MGKKIIMSWSKCKIEVGKTGDDEAMAASLTDIGTCLLYTSPSPRDS